MPRSSWKKCSEVIDPNRKDTHMRFLLLTLALLCCAIPLAGCCGAASADAQTATGSPDAYSYPVEGVARPAAMASDVTSTGCSLRAGIECGGDSMLGFAIDLPDLRTVFSFFTGAGALPFATRRGTTLAEAAAQARTTEARSKESCPDGGCGVPGGAMTEPYFLTDVHGVRKLVTPGGER